MPEWKCYKVIIKNKREMVRQDIVAGLRNALERGYSLEQAKKTLLNAGYNQGDVLEAANYLTGGLGTQPEHHEPSEQQRIGVQQFEQQPQQQIQQIATQKPKDKEPRKDFPITIIILVLTLIFLISSLIVAFIFKDQLIGFFEGL